MGRRPFFISPSRPQRAGSMSVAVFDRYGANPLPQSTAITSTLIVVAVDVHDDIVKRIRPGVARRPRQVLRGVTFCGGVQRRVRR